ncbi:MAG: glycoside hydrolase family 125 protein [Lachnospiraceae bacterium]|nr:glycoside hydrolase family 125 protein [Lachnospiraceae bacterium]
MELTKGLQDLLRADCEKIGEGKICEVYRKCFRSTWETTLSMEEDGSAFVITGDIGAMWLRDSSMQVLPYFRALSDEAVERAIRGLIGKQAKLILTDAYANAFNKNGDYSCYSRDKTEMGAFIWERKYEVDSLAFPIMLLAKYVAATGRQDILTKEVPAALDRVLEVWETEQRHEASPYTFERDSDLETETLQNQGRGTPTAYTGMTWSGFRPSDDACRYHYLVPSNMLAVSALRRLCALPVGEETVCRAKKLAEEMEKGIYQYGIFAHPQFGEIFAYETDGLGHYNLMDDANVPSLLAAPWFGFCKRDDALYQNTRRFILSSSNPYYYKGNAAEGVGSPHTPAGYVWHIAIAIRGLTAESREEQKNMLDMLIHTTAGTDYMHEGVDVNAPERYTRPWFAWANSMFCLLAEAYFHL